MRDKNRIKPLLADLEKIWNKNPELRLCQLLKILATTYNDFKGHDLFYFEDKDLQIAIDKYKKMHNL